MSEYYEIIEKIEGISTCRYCVHGKPYCFSGFFRNWERRSTSTPCVFICRKIVDSERRGGKQVENKERHFKEVAKGKYTRTRVCLTMKITDLKHFMLRFILNDYGDTHHLRTRDISPENIGTCSFITVTHVVSNCFHSSIVTFLACKVTYKIMFLRNVCTCIK